MSHLWSAAATGAVPYAEDLALYSSANGRLRFKAGATGRIRVVCNVTNVRDLESVRHLHVTYRDAGRAPEQGQVSAVLKKVNRISGNIINVAGFSSESAPTGAEFFTGKSVRLQDDEIPLDDTEHYYYVVITIERSDDETQNPTVLGVYLDPGV